MSGLFFQSLESFGGVHPDGSTDGIRLEADVGKRDTITTAPEQPAVSSEKPRRTHSPHRNTVPTSKTTGKRRAVSSPTHHPARIRLPWVIPDDCPDGNRLETDGGKRNTATTHCRSLQRVARSDGGKFVSPEDDSGFQGRQWFQSTRQSVRKSMSGHLWTCEMWACQAE